MEFPRPVRGAPVVLVAAGAGWLALAAYALTLDRALAGLAGFTAFVFAVGGALVAGGLWGSRWGAHPTVAETAPRPDARTSGSVARIPSDVPVPPTLTPPAPEDWVARATREYPPAGYGRSILGSLAASVEPAARDDVASTAWRVPREPVYDPLGGPEWELTPALAGASHRSLAPQPGPGVEVELFRLRERVRALEAERAGVMPFHRSSATRTGPLDRSAATGKVPLRAVECGGCARSIRLGEPAHSCASCGRPLCAACYDRHGPAAADPRCAQCLARVERAERPASDARAPPLATAGRGGRPPAPDGVPIGVDR